MKRIPLIGFGITALAIAIIPVLVALSMTTAKAQMPPSIPTLYYGAAPGAVHGQRVVAYIGEVACGGGSVVVVDGTPNYVVDVVTDSQIPGCGLGGRQIKLYFPSITGTGYFSTTTTAWQSAGAPRVFNVTLGGPELTNHNMAVMSAKDGLWY
jgi:hypothetical protein